MRQAPARPSARHRLEYAAFRAGFALMRALPADAAYGAGAWCARRWFDWADPRARVARANLRIAFPDLPESERSRIARESYVHLAWNAIDVARSTRWSAAELRDRFEVVGYEHYRAALARGRGVLVLVPHVGSFELALMAVPLFDVAITAIARPLANRLVEREVYRQRTRYGAELIHHRRVAPRMLRALRERRNVVIVNDQYARRSKGVLAPFFGVRASTSPGAATLALRSGAPVLPFYVARLSRDRHRAVCLPPIEVERTGSYAKDVEAATAKFNEVLESVIREHPEQWMWGHRRFRNSPDLPADPYAPAR